MESRQSATKVVHAGQRLFRSQDSFDKGLRGNGIPSLPLTAVNKLFPGRMAYSIIISGQLWMRQIAAPVISVKQ